MPAKKKTTRRKSSKAPSPAQLRARKAFALAAKARSKASKKKASKKPKRRNKTIITKPKKVVVINSKKAALPKLGPRDAGWVAVRKSDGEAVAEFFKDSKAVHKVDLTKFDLVPTQKYLASLNKKNPAKSTRRKYRNGYLDLVIMGHAKKTPSGWSLGGKTFKQGKGIVPASKRGYYLDLGTGTVFSKKARNVAQGFFDGNGVFHPIRSSADYDSGTAGETGKKPIRTRSKKRKTALKKAGQTARLKAETRRRKSTTSRLASRSLSRSAGILKGSGSRRQRKNPLHDTYGWTTSKTTGGYKWKVTGFTYGQGTETLKEGISSTRAMAITQAKKHVMPYRRALEASRKRNPSVKSIRKEFAGTLGKASDVFAPIGTPRNVAKLGKLLLIDTENATIKPTGIVYLCADSKGKLHLCGSKNVPIYSGGAQSFGRVKKLEYETAKPHLYPGQGTIQFWHKMGEGGTQQPTLIADGKGGLKFRGGEYKITREGIVG